MVFVIAYEPDCFTFQARLEASISWLVTKAYGRNIPKDFREQFYIDKHVGIFLSWETNNGGC